MPHERLTSAARTASGALILLLASTALANAQSAVAFQVLYTFGAPNDGVGPSSGVIFDKQGNAYGETLSGGNTACEYGCGTVYKLTPQRDGSWAEATIYGFTGSGDGYNPDGGLAMDTAGNLYGVAQSGGANDRGTIFELSPNGGVWTETTLYAFCSLPSCADGAVPFHGPVMDQAGNLYGTAGGYGGVAYELSPGPSGWTETVLYTFCSQPDCSDGNFPGQLIRDPAGNLYGPANEGGSSLNGAIFELMPQPNGQWQYQLLYSFQGGNDGMGPSGVTLHGGACTE